MKTNLKVRQNALIYTKESIARVLGIVASRVTRTMVWWSGFWILIKGRSPRLYKKSLFTADFANFRKESAKNYSVKRTSIDNHQELYNVTREIRRPGCSHTTSTYKVSVNLKEIAPCYVCECQDYIQSAEVFRAPACKHIYAVLNFQGFGSLKEAIDSGIQKAAAAAKADIGL